MPLAWRMAVNPANTKMKYILWDNGRIEPVTRVTGAQPPPAVPQDAMDPTHSAGKAPIAPDTADAEHVVVAFQITDWAGPGGYTFTKYGQVFEFGTAAPVAAALQPVAGTLPYGDYKDFVMDPAANGQGYALGSNGTIPRIGGSPIIESLDMGDAAGIGIAQRIVMPDFATKHYTIFDLLGRRHARHGAIDLVGTIQQPSGVQTFAPLDLFYNGYIGTAEVLYDTLDPGGGHGWALGAFGMIHSLNGAQLVFGNPETDGWAQFSDLAILDNGLGANPLRLAVLDIYGNITEFNVSTAPVVTASTVQPLDPTTNTTRPTLSAIYADAEGDAAQLWQVRVFSAAQYGIGGFDPAVSPATWSTDIGMPLARNFQSVQVPLDLANATYRFYMRAQDTSGLWSAWASRQWVQNVTPPVTPTMTVTPGATPIAGTTIAVDASAVTLGAVFSVEFSDSPAPGPSDWLYVRGGDALIPDGSKHAQVVDRDATYGVARSYRARQLVASPTLVGAYCATQAVTITSQVYTLIDPFSSDALIISVRRSLEWDRELIAGTFPPDGRADQVVITGENALKLPEMKLPIRTMTEGDYNVVERMVASGHVLLYRDPYKRSYYVKPNAKVHYKPIPAAPAPGDTTPMRHVHEIDIPIATTARPLSGPSSGPLALIPPS